MLLHRPRSVRVLVAMLAGVAGLLLGGACGKSSGSSSGAVASGASTSVGGATGTGSQTIGASAAAASPRTFPVPTDSINRQLMARLSALSADSMEGRLAGSPGGARARAWIERELASIGVAPLAAGYTQPVKVRSRGGAAGDTLGANVIARIPGRNSALPAIVLSAHYDHLGVRNGEVFNGADDDASGCIAILTLAERVKQEGLEHDLIVVFFDAEESGLLGAKAFVASPPVPLNRIAIDINLDMVGRQDAGALWVSGLSHNPFLRDVVTSASSTSRVKILLGHDTKDLKPGDDWTHSSDHGAFHAKGIPFLYLGVEDHPDYHRAGDEANRIDPAFYRGVVDFAEQLLRSVDRAAGQFPVRP